MADDAVSASVWNTAVGQMQATRIPDLFAFFYDPTEWHSPEPADARLCINPYRQMTMLRRRATTATPCRPRRALAL